VLRENPWDEELALMEHAPWFWTLKQQGQWRVAFTDNVVIKHYRDRSDPAYSQIRDNVADYRKLVAQKYGFSGTFRVPNDVEVRDMDVGLPNIIIMGMVHSGTRMFSTILSKLGWNLGDYDEHFIENIPFTRVNKRILCEMGLGGACNIRKNADTVPDYLQLGLCDKCGGTANNADQIVDILLDNLESPWVLKDPRIVMTISDYRWQRAIHRVKPLLLYVERDPKRMKKTFDTSNEDLNNLWGLKFEEMRQKARMEYENYPYAKVFIKYEDVIAAAKSIDFERAK
jgi:hypothetical protein